MLIRGRAILNHTWAHKKYTWLPTTKRMPRFQSFQLQKVFNIRMVLNSEENHFIEIVTITWNIADLEPQVQICTEADPRNSELVTGILYVIQVPTSFSTGVCRIVGTCS